MDSLGKTPLSGSTAALRASYIVTPSIEVICVVVKWNAPREGYVGALTSVRFIRSGAGPGSSTSNGRGREIATAATSPATAKPRNGGRTPRRDVPDGPEMRAAFLTVY